jgi:putative toxin-antitoxin system antitoxin component (TIGR02293 family)
LPTSFLENATASTEIDRENLARALGMNIRSLARHKKENHLSESESDNLYRFARVVAIVMEKTGNLDAAMKWLTEPSFELRVCWLLLSSG